MDNRKAKMRQKDISLVSRVMKVDESEIKGIEFLNKGMTNKSFKFTIGDTEYILRTPGEGTEKLINRQNEYNVYQAIEEKDISDNVIYISGDDGYKISEFWEHARVCDPLDKDDIDMCMDKLRDFHNLKLEVDHSFDMFKEMDFYESILDGPSMFKDYKETKENITKLKAFIDSLPKERILSHIDSIPDNFLIVDKDVHLIDWEYAGMQDPHVDIAMFSIYSLYDRAQTDFLIDSYFKGECTLETRMKIYAYMAVAGLLWSNWCEFKLMFGEDFGEYSLKQYDYARDYYEIVRDEFLER